MAIFNSYVKLPEGIEHQGDGDSHGPPLFDQVGAFGPTST